MELELENQETHEERIPQVFESAGGFSPTIGIIGAVLGLIQVMQHLDNIAEVGRGNSRGLCGHDLRCRGRQSSLSALRRKAENPYAGSQLKRAMMLEGVISILEGLNPRIVETKLQGFLADVGCNPNDAKGAGSREAQKKGEHANHERWLVSYADFMTLLFAFFVVLFSSSQVDKRKVGRLAMAIQVAFEHLGVFESSNSKMPLSTTEPMPFDNVQIIEKVVKTTDISQPVPSAKGSRGGLVCGERHDAAHADLQQAFDAEIKRNEISIRAGHEGIIITLREIGFFGQWIRGSELKSEPTVARIAKVARRPAVQYTDRRSHGQCADPQ